MPGEADRRLDAAAESYLDAIARELASADLPERQRGELLANVRELLAAGASPAAVGAAEDVVSAYAEAADGADGARDLGHLDMIEAAAAMGDKLIVIVNNDKQQLLKKGKIILDESNRLRLMRALKGVDQVILSIDEDPSIIKSLEMVAGQYPGDELIFANGGDRDTEKAIPEADVCKKYNIQMRFDAGKGKPDSSTRINQATGKE